MAGPSGARSQGTKPLDAGKGAMGLRSLLPGAAHEFAELAYCAPAYWRLRRLYNECRPDIIYQRYNLFYYPGAWLRRAEPTPFILEVNAPLAQERARHGNLALKRLAHQSEGKIWRAADMVLPVTNVLAERVRAAGVPDDKILVIQNGVGEDYLGEINSKTIRKRYNLSNRFILGFTGFVRDWHGVDQVLRFMAQHGRDDLHLLLVGDGPARDGLEALARELGLARRITITGVVQREDIPAHTAAFDIALQPAVVDYASPLKLFEYMALGRPIAAPDSANIREILTSGEDALLFDQDIGGAFEESLSALIESAQLRARLGAAARESLLRQELTWAANAARVEALAQNLIGNRS